MSPAAPSRRPSRSRQALRRSLAALLLTSALASPAFAAPKTGNPIADAFLASLEARGLENIQVGAVTGGPGTADISTLTGELKPEPPKPPEPSADGTPAPQPPAPPPPQKVTVEHVLIDKATADAGRVKADVLDLKGLSLVDGEDTVTIGEITADGVEIPSAADIAASPNSTKGQATYKHAQLNDILIRGKDNYQVPIRSITMETDDISNGVPHKVSLAINDVAVNVANMPDDDTRKQLARLGYTSLDLSLQASGTWDEAKATANLDTFQFGGPGIGTLTLTGSFGGVTADAIAKLESAKTPDETTQVLQSLTVNRLDLSFKNDTLVERLLDAQAKDQGTTPAAIVEQLSAALPQLLAPLSDVTFRNKVTDAGTNFLKAPKSITATVAPPKPLPFAQVLGTAMMAPQTLPDVLNADVKANQ